MQHAAQAESGARKLSAGDVGADAAKSIGRRAKKVVKKAKKGSNKANHKRKKYYTYFKKRKQSARKD